jgi:multimeric flavodoxin WrbA
LIKADPDLKRLLGISASRRPWGNCETSIKSILVSAADEGAETEFLRLTDLKIEACRGCFTCLVRGKACPIEDDLYTLLEAVDSADAVAVAVPVYFLLPPAALVALLDRLLTMGGRKRSGVRSRPAVTLAIMGNYEWRGVARPAINMTVSLLGFDIVESMHLVAEGPGEVIMDGRVAARLEEVGRLLARGEEGTQVGAGAACPVCASDFFRIEPPDIICPICGSVGDLAVYTCEKRFERKGDDVRWGQSWLDRHIASWIEPSLRRYRDRRKQVLGRLRELKAQYSGEQGKG